MSTRVFGRKLDAFGEPYGHLLTSTTVVCNASGDDYLIKWDGDGHYVPAAQCVIVPPLSHDSRRALKALLKPSTAMRIMYEQERIERSQRYVRDGMQSERMPKPPSGKVV